MHDRRLVTRMAVTGWRLEAPWWRTREYLPVSCGGPRRTEGSGWLDDRATVHENDRGGYDICAVLAHDSRCFNAMKQCVSWPQNTMFHPNSRCFMTVKHTFLSWFNVFHDHETTCFILTQHVSRCFMVMKQIFHCWFSLIQHVSSMFHHCSITLIHPV